MNAVVKKDLQKVKPKLWIYLSIIFIIIFIKYNLLKLYKINIKCIYHLSNLLLSISYIFLSSQYNVSENVP